MKLSFKNLLMEYQVLPYKRIADYDGKVTIRFDAGGLRYEASLWHNPNKHDVGEYELEFNASGQKHAGDRTKKDMSHFFNVVYTVIDAMEAIVKEKKIRKVKFEGAGDEEDTNMFWEPTLRAKVYWRIVTNRYPEEALFGSGRHIKIDMTKVFPELFVGQEKTNADKIVDLLMQISDGSEETPEGLEENIRRGLSGGDENTAFYLSTDFIDSLDYGNIYIRISVFKETQNYSIEMDFYDTDEDEQHDFRNFEELYSFLKYRFLL
jgi:hypothetical protein